MPVISAMHELKELPQAGQTIFQAKILPRLQHCRRRAYIQSCTTSYIQDLLGLELIRCTESYGLHRHICKAAKVEAAIYAQLGGVCTYHVGSRCMPHWQ